MTDVLIRKAKVDDLNKIQNLNNELFKLEKENYDIRVENARLKEENEILRQKMDALLTFIKDHKNVTE